MPTTINPTSESQIIFSSYYCILGVLLKHARARPSTPEARPSSAGARPAEAPPRKLYVGPFIRKQSEP